MNVKQFGVFCVGAIVGATSCYFLLNNHYKKLAQTEIDSVKEYFAKRKEQKEQENDIPKEQEKTNSERIETEVVDYGEYAAKKIGDQLQENEKNRREEVMVKYEHPSDEDTLPYIIDDKTVGSVSFYSRATLLYYMGNDTLVDEESDEPVDDIEGTIGFDNLEILKSIPETTIYVRNVGYGIDYEVIKINGDWM